MFAELANEFITFLRGIDFWTRVAVIIICIILTLWSVIKFVAANVQKERISWLYFAIAILLITTCILLSVFD